MSKGSPGGGAANTSRGGNWLRSIPVVAAWLPATATAHDPVQPDRIDWLRAIPFVLVHLMACAIIWVGWSPVAVATAVALYFFRIFAITAFYHRYFSHRSFKTSRAMQFVFALAGASAAQRGPLWWAAHHRRHHARSDQPGDAHSPAQSGFWWSHVGWFLSRRNLATDSDRVRDLARFPELRWLDRFDVLVPVALATTLFLLGGYLGEHRPDLGTSSAQMLVWGFFVSTVAVYHVTYTVNSLCHAFGRRRYDTPDQSRNNVWLALLTLGEGWHNNHHHYPGSARQGFYWWELDLTYYLLRGMAAVRLIWDLKTVPVAVRESRGRRRGSAATDPRPDQHIAPGLPLHSSAKVART